LLVLGAIACGAVYMVLYSGPAVVKRTVSEPPSRTLAYEQQVNRPGAAPAASEQGTQKHAMAPSEAPAQPAAPQSAPAPDAQAAATEENDAEADSPAQESASPQTANLPPDEADEAGLADPEALPWQRSARPDYPAAEGERPYGSDPMAGRPGEDANPSDDMAGRPGEDAYPSDDMAGRPGEQGDPNAWPGNPQEEPQEWVQVLVSGAGMHGTASEDAPALFVFPSGRPLRVVSRYGNWVEVTDPQSAATGWMKAQYLAPMAAPRGPGDAEAMYDDEDEYDDGPFRRRGWFRRNGGGLADMINRALGGH
jgi:hypothetical protein